MNRYTIMHKDIAVAEIELNNNSQISTVTDVYDENHLPIGIARNIRSGKVESSSLNAWWGNRCIPASREGISNLLKEVSIDSTQKLLEKSFGLSLSDHYWIKPNNKNITWEEVNFYQNDFSEDVGKLLLGEILDDKAKLSLVSPDNASDGNLKKRWKIINDERCLVKSGALPFHQHPFNEVIATIIMERLGIPHTSYKLLWSKDKPYSVCKNFTTVDTEHVSAWSILSIRNMLNHENEYLQYVTLCKEHGLTDIEHSLDMMITLDYLMLNEDRHFRNFGIIRDVKTLEWLYPTPIFDTGSSLGYNKPFSRLYSDDYICKPFKKTFSEQMKLVKSFDWLDLSKLDGIRDEVFNLLNTDKFIALTDSQRPYQIAVLVESRVESLEKFVKNYMKKSILVQKPTGKSISDPPAPKE